MTISLSQFRVSAAMDASGFVAGVEAIDAANRRIVASGQAAGAALAAQDAAAGRTGGTMVSLSKAYVDGYAGVSRFTQQVSQLQTQFELGNVKADRAAQIYTGLSSKFQLYADAVKINAAGNRDFAAVIDQVNAKASLQIDIMNRAAAAQQRVAQAQAAQTLINSRLGVVEPGSNTALRESDIAAYGASLDDLRAKYNPLFAAERAHAEAIEDVTHALRVGAIDQREYTTEVDRLTAALDKQRASIVKPSQTSLHNTLGINPNASYNGDAEESAKTFEAEARRLDDLRARYEPLYGAQRAYNAEVENINKLRASGNITEEVHVAALSRANAAYQSQAKYIRDGHSASAQYVGGLTQLSFQINDVVTGLMTGQGAFQVFGQQAGQFFQIWQVNRNIFSEAGNAIKTFGGYVLSFATPIAIGFTTIAAAALTAVAALLSYSSAQREIDRTLSGIGRASGVTRNDINAAALSGASALGLSVSEAREFGTELASTGKIGTAVLTQLVGLGHEFAKALRIDGKDAAAALAKAISDPVSGAEQLNQRFGFLDAAQQRMIKNLTEQNKLAQAQQIIVDNLSRSIADANIQTGFWSKTWTGISNAISDSYDWLGRLMSRATGVGETLEEQYAAQRKLVESLQSRPSNFGGRVANSQVLPGEIAKLDQLRAKIDAVRKASEDAASRMQSTRITSAALSFLPEVNQLDVLKNKQELLVNAMLDVVTTGGAASEVLKRLGLTYEQLADAVKKSSDAVKNFKTDYERALETQSVQLKAVTAFSPTAKADIAFQERYNAEIARGTDETRAAALAEGARTIALRQSQVAMSEAARERQLSARQTLESADLEISLIGKTIGEQTRLRADLQARQQLEQEAARNRTAVDEAEYARLQKINAELGKKAEARARADIRNQIGFDQATVGLSAEDVQIAKRLMPLYNNNIPSALASTEAAQIRVVNAAQEMNDAFRGAGASLVSSFMQGKSALESVTGAATQLIQRLASKQFDKFMSGDFKSPGVGGLASFQGVAGIGGAGLAGYQSGSPLGGALGGALAGFSVGGPVGAVIGGAVGLIGGFLGKASKDKAELEAAIQRSKDAWKAMATQVASLSEFMRGDVAGSLTKEARQTEQQFVQAWNAAHAAYDDDAAAKLAGEYAAYVKRITTEFKASFDVMIDALNSGGGLDNDFMKATQNVKGVANQLKGFITDTVKAFTDGYEFLAGTNYSAGQEGTVSQADTARAAAQKYLLSLLDGGKELSAVSSDIETLNGTARQLKVSLVELGMSAEQAAAAVSAGVTKEMNRLRDAFTKDITAQINAAEGKNYINEFNDLFDNVKKMSEDAANLGADPALVDRYFSVQAQKIVDDAGLIGDSFNDLLKTFPSLAGTIHESTDALNQQIEAQKALRQTVQDFLDSLDTGNLSTLTPQGQFEAAQKAFEKQLMAAKTGDENAMSSITQVAHTFIEQARSFLGPSEQYGQVVANVTSKLKGLVGIDGGGDRSGLPYLPGGGGPVTNGIGLDGLPYLPGGGGVVSNGIGLDGLPYLPGGGGAVANDNGLDRLPYLPGGGEVSNVIGLDGLPYLPGGGSMVRGYAAGGLVANGIYNVDSVLARFAGGGEVALAGNEFVTRAPSVNTATMPALDFINRTGRAPENDNSDLIAELRASRAENKTLMAMVVRLLSEGNSDVRDQTNELKGLRTDTRQQANEKTVRKNSKVA